VWGLLSSFCAARDAYGLKGGVAEDNQSQMLVEPDGVGVSRRGVQERVCPRLLISEPEVEGSG
jgi:hypothetical protein